MMTLSAPPAEIPRQVAPIKDGVLQMKCQFSVLQICPSDFSVSLLLFGIFLKIYLSTGARIICQHMSA